MVKDKNGVGPRLKAKRARQAEIEKKVDKYVKSNEVKDENGVVIDNPVLVVTPENMFEFYRSGIFSGLSKEEGLIAKHYFKSLLPFKAYNESRAKDKNLRIEDIIHFRDLIEGGKI